MPRATTQLQKARSGSQQNKRQRATRSRPEPEEEEEEEVDNRNDEEDEDNEEEDRMDVDDEEDGQGNEIQRKANSLVRMALFVEYRRTPLRRDDIIKKVMSSNSRAFNHVFEAAQEKLRKVFGMELIELRSRAEIIKDAIGADDDENERRGAASKKKAAPSGSKTYILRSVLDPQIIKGANMSDEQILEDEAAEQPSEDDDDDPGSHSVGSIISWNFADQVGPIGILYVILALILVNGRVITDADLRAHLKKLRLSSGGQVNFTAHSTHPVITIDTYLTNLVKQGYLDRQQIGETKKKGGTKRVRAQDEDESVKYEWRWGNRAECEVGEQALAEFVAEFMVRSQADDDDDDDAGLQQRSKGRGGSAFDKMLKGIEKAAGGNLAELRAE